MRLLFLFLCFSASSAHAAKKPKAPKTPEQKLAAVEAAYDETNFATAVKLARPLLDAQSATIRQRARMLLAFSQYLLRDEAAAKATVRELFRENVDAPFDRDMHHPDLVRFYESERNAYVASLKVEPVKIAAPVSQPASAPVMIVVAPPPPQPASEPVIVTPVTPVTPVQTLGDRHPWLRIIPIVGHFANYDRVGGGVFLALELAFIGMNVGGAIALRQLRYPEGDARRGAVEALIIEDIGGFAAITVAVICVIDAFVWSPARGRAALAKSRLQPTVNLGALGGYRLSFF